MQPLSRPARVPEEIIEAFRAVAPVVEDFARANDLLVERYRHGKAAWELRFARRAGGQATITISYRERTGHVLDVSAVWWIDDSVARTRRLRSGKIGVYDRRAPGQALRQHLTSALARIDAWTQDDLGPAYGPFKDMPRNRTTAPAADEREELPVR